MAERPFAPLERRTCGGKDCGAEIVFIPSAKTGALQPFDAEPRKAGVLVVRNHAAGDVLFLSLVDLPERRAAKIVDVYTPHHATCPNAADFRRRPA